MQDVAWTADGEQTNMVRDGSIRMMTRWWNGLGGAENGNWNGLNETDRQSSSKHGTRKQNARTNEKNKTYKTISTPRPRRRSGL